MVGLAQDLSSYDHRDLVALGFSLDPLMFSCVSLCYKSVSALTAKARPKKKKKQKGKTTRAQLYCIFSLSLSIANYMILWYWKFYRILMCYDGIKSYYFIYVYTYICTWISRHRCHSKGNGVSRCSSISKIDFVLSAWDLFSKIPLVCVSSHFLFFDELSSSGIAFLPFGEEGSAWKETIGLNSKNPILPSPSSWMKWSIWWN